MLMSRYDFPSYIDLCPEPNFYAKKKFLETPGMNLAITFTVVRNR
jgi:hypothetical protein